MTTAESSSEQTVATLAEFQEQARQDDLARLNAAIGLVARMPGNFGYATVYDTDNRNRYLAIGQPGDTTPAELTYQPPGEAQRSFRIIDRHTDSPRLFEVLLVVEGRVREEKVTPVTNSLLVAELAALATYGTQERPLSVQQKLGKWVISLLDKW